jgi:hypothetical protein
LILKQEPVIPHQENVTTKSGGESIVSGMEIEPSPEINIPSQNSVTHGEKPSVEGWQSKSTMPLASNIPFTESQFIVTMLPDSEDEPDSDYDSDEMSTSDYFLSSKGKKQNPCSGRGKTLPLFSQTGKKDDLPLVQRGKTLPSQKDIEDIIRRISLNSLDNDTSIEDAEFDIKDTLSPDRKPFESLVPEELRVLFNITHENQDVVLGFPYLSEEVLLRGNIDENTPVPPLFGFEIDVTKFRQGSL